MGHAVDGNKGVVSSMLRVGYEIPAANGRGEYPCKFSSSATHSIYWAAYEWSKPAVFATAVACLRLRAQMLRICFDLCVEYRFE